MPKKCKEDDTQIREIILDAAKKIGIEQGVDKITARRISSAIGYSTGVIYYHFQNKQEIMDILRQNRDADIYEVIRKCIGTDSTLRENCSQIMDCLYTIGVSGEQQNAQLLSGAYYDVANSGFWMDLIQQVLDVAVKRGETAPDHMDAAVYCLWSFFSGYAMLLAEYCPSDAAALRNVSGEMLDVLLQGLY
ncbi:MAG: TetR/AcrR family transcriptional regulator [Clostridiales bacterium]|nr:TetR/AcrR family transcriptional regulator [Clostridiales bacterium]